MYQNLRSRELVNIDKVSMHVERSCLYTAATCRHSRRIILHADSVDELLRCRRRRTQYKSVVYTFSMSARAAKVRLSCTHVVRAFCDKKWDRVWYSMSRNDTGWQNSRAKTKLVLACIKNGKRTAASKSITLQLYQWEKKPRKTTEEMDGQCKGRYRSKEVDCTTSNGSDVGQKQMETSSSSLIIIEIMEESRRRRSAAFWVIKNEWMNEWLVDCLVIIDSHVSIPVSAVIPSSYISHCTLITSIYCHGSYLYNYICITPFIYVRSQVLPCHAPSQQLNKGQSNSVKRGITDRCCHLVNHKSSFVRTLEAIACFGLGFDLRISRLFRGPATKALSLDLLIYMPKGI